MSKRNKRIATIEAGLSGSTTGIVLDVLFKWNLDCGVFIVKRLRHYNLVFFVKHQPFQQIETTPTMKRNVFGA